MISTAGDILGGEEEITEDAKLGTELGSALAISVMEEGCSVGTALVPSDGDILGAEADDGLGGTVPRDCVG